MSFRKAWSRLERLSWDELRTRAGQGASKRADLARYWLGFGFGDQANGTPAPEREETPRSALTFFFNPAEIPRRIQLLRLHMPKEVERICREADAIRHHRFELLGYKDLDYGTDVDWHLDAVHGKRAPLKPWFKINFLDFSEVGDHKVIWELNRHQHLVTLAKAWWLTKDLNYLRELEAQWHSWQKANPYPLGINWASTLEVAFRSLSWLWVRHLLLDCSAFQLKSHTAMVSALRFNGRYIERYLSKYFSPNTHLLGEAVALFAIATLLPDFPESPRWQKVAWKIVIEESKRQVRPDGVYFEQALYYHVYALDFFLYARMLAARTGVTIPTEFDGVLGKMLDVVAALAQGPLEGFGDDDGGRVFDPRRNRVEHTSDPLVIGAIEYANPDLAANAQLTEEAIWLFGDRALALLGERSRPAVTRSQAFESGGIYLMRDDQISNNRTSDDRGSDDRTSEARPSDHESLPQQLMIDAGPLGAGNAGHGHADALSLRFSIGGDRVLVDPGTCCYISHGNERATFRGTAAHNTLRVDQVDQAVPAGPFAWTSLPETRVERWLQGETFSLLEATHTGYRRLSDPVGHRRTVFHPNGEFWLIRDVVEGRQTHQLETFWHFGPQIQVRQQGNSLIGSPAQRIADRGDASRSWSLALLPANSREWQAEINSGKISPAYGALESAPIVRIHARVQLPAESAMLLVPMTAGAKAGEFRKLTEAPREVEAYSYATGHASHHLFFASHPAAWTYADWSSDAPLLYVRAEDGKLQSLVMCGGGYVKWQDKILVSHRAPVERFELFTIQGRLTAASSDPAMLEQAVDGAVDLQSQSEKAGLEKGLAENGWYSESQSEKAGREKRNLEKARP